MIQPARQKIVVFGQDTIELIVWTDVPLSKILKINGVYDAYGTRPMVVQCDPRYMAADIERAICELAEEV